MKSDVTCPPSISSPSPSSIGRRRRTTSESIRTKSLGEKNSWEDEPTIKILPIYRRSSWTVSYSNSNHIQKVGSHPKFFGMSNSSDIICLYYTILSIMKSGFWSLIVSCLHSLQFSRKAQNAKRYFDSLFRVKAAPQLSKPKPNQSTPLFLYRAWRKRKRRGHM